MRRYCMFSASISSDFLGVEIMGVAGFFGIAVLDSKPWRALSHASASSSRCANFPSDYFPSPTFISKCGVYIDYAEITGIPE